MLMINIEVTDMFHKRYDDKHDEAENSVSLFFAWLYIWYISRLFSFLFAEMGQEPAFK